MCQLALAGVLCAAHLGAVIYAPLSTGKHNCKDTDFPPVAVRQAFENLVLALEECAHDLINGDMHVRASLDPRALLEQPLADMQVAVVASFEHGSLAVSIGP